MVHIHHPVAKATGSNLGKAAALKWRKTIYLRGVASRQSDGCGFVTGRRGAEIPGTIIGGPAMINVHIDQLDDAAKKQLLKAVADRGYANGLDAAAKILDALAEGRMRVVGTNEIREISGALKGKAAHLRNNADGALRTLEAQTQ